MNGRFSGWRCLALMLPIVLAGIAEARVPAMQARLARCEGQTCLLIEGHRADARAVVRVAGHEVAASGRRGFTVSLPLETVRDWSAPFARTIAVRVGSPGAAGQDVAVRLPTGLLGHTTELAALDIEAP